MDCGAFTFYANSFDKFWRRMKTLKGWIRYCPWFRMALFNGSTICLLPQSHLFLTSSSQDNFITFFFTMKIVFDEFYTLSQAANNKKVSLVFFKNKERFFSIEARLLPRGSGCKKNLLVTLFEAVQSRRLDSCQLFSWKQKSLNMREYQVTYDCKIGIKTNLFLSFSYICMSVCTFWISALSSQSFILIHIWIGNVNNVLSKFHINWCDYYFTRAFDKQLSVGISLYCSSYLIQSMVGNAIIDLQIPRLMLTRSCCWVGDGALCVSWS